MTDARLDDNDFDVQREILTHLASRPYHDATWEGILEWWLMERAIDRETRRMDRALAALVEGDWLRRRRGRDGKFRYAIVPERREEIRRRFGFAAFRESG